MFGQAITKIQLLQYYRSSKCMEMHALAVVVSQFTKLNAYTLHKGLNILVSHPRGGSIKPLVNLKKLNIDRSTCMYMCKLCVRLMMKNAAHSSFVKYLFVLCNKQKMNCFFMHDITLFFVLFAQNIMKSCHRLTSEKGEGLSA